MASPETTVLGGVTLANSKTCDEKIGSQSSQVRALSNTLISQSVGTDKKEWAISWVNVSQTARDIIVIQYKIKDMQTFSPPDTVSLFNVFIGRKTYSENKVNAGADVKYNISFTILEA